MYLPLDGTAQRPPKRCSGVQIVSASHTGDKRMSFGKFIRIAYARQIEIVPATFISTLCESRLPFPKTTTATRRPTRLNEAHPAQFANQLDRARTAVRGSGHEVFELSERGDDSVDQVSIGTMHLAKGLEFKAVAVMACDDEVLPLQARIESVADEVDLDDVYETERQLLYVACTRARDRLLVTGVGPGSEFLSDLK
jgi:superfamily I DNA/RNA helicase